MLSTPRINRGTAFTLEERRALELTGLLPGGVSTMEGQLRRVYAQYQRVADDLAKNVYLANLRDRNEILFYRLLAEHLAEMLPIVYTPTIGKAIERFSHEYSRRIAQANNALVFPGLGLGVTVSRARRISDGMLAAAADAVAELSDASTLGAPLLPSVEVLRRVSAAAGVAVALAADKEGLAQAALDDPVQQVHQTMWRPVYPRIEPI